MCFGVGTVFCFIWLRYVARDWVDDVLHNCRIDPADKFRDGALLEGIWFTGQ
jgi:hypothetical protein